MYQIQQIPGRTALINGTDYLYFSGTDYLGIGHLPEFQELLEAGMKKYGLNFGGSRLSNIRFDIFDEAETMLAQLGQAEAALSVSSGTLAGQLVSKYFEGLAELHYAPGSHPALQSGVGKIYQSRVDWARSILHLSHQSGTPIVAFTDAIDALQVRLFDFQWLKELGHAREVILVIDDSHTWGISGNQGGASFTLVEAPEHVEIITLGSLGKAFGIPAGFILGSSKRIKSLWQSPFFGGASPTLPAFLYAMTLSWPLYEQQRESLFANIQDFQERLKSKSYFSICPGYPVFRSSLSTLAEYLFQHNILISSFPYPTPDSALITRIVINALHTPEDITKLATLVQDFFVKKHHL